MNEKKKTNENTIERDHDAMNYQSNRQQIKKKSPKKGNDRMYSEQSWKRGSRAQDRSELSKKKREQMLEEHLMRGDEYL